MVFIYIISLLKSNENKNPIWVKGLWTYPKDKRMEIPLEWYSLPVGVYRLYSELTIRGKPEVGVTWKTEAGGLATLHISVQG